MTKVLELVVDTLDDRGGLFTYPALGRYTVTLLSGQSRGGFNFAMRPIALA